MPTRHRQLPPAIALSFALSFAFLGDARADEPQGSGPADGPVPVTLAAAPLPTIARHLAVGDIVFIRVPSRPFTEVADATGTWTNHVGIVIGDNGREPLVAESAVPWSRVTPLSRFVARSEQGRVAALRLRTPPTPTQRAALVAAAQRRLGIWYDTGFDLHSPREFCSRYVHEVVLEATGTPVGDVETFADLLRQNPTANERFWKFWFMGSIPWQRQTITPGSLLQSDRLQTVFDGVALRGTGARAPSPGRT